MTENVVIGAPREKQSGQTLVIAGAALGTLFEWFDFFLYAALAGPIARHFFTGVSETTGFILALMALGAGFAVRPFGALVFGRVGDIVGRKNTFLVTMAIMGVSTFLVGVLPGFETIGIAAPLLLVMLRLLQGLALGGEYGGAAIYVAEHSPARDRGLNTSWINGVGTLGLALSLASVLVCRLLLSDAAFQEWGWRLPFLTSVVLLVISLWVRVKLGESPVFQRMKAEGTTSKAPFAESFGDLNNVKRMLAVVFGWVAGGTTAWYMAQIYTLFFLERMLKLDGFAANLLVVIALLIAAPTYLLFGWLSDRIGRKPIILVGCALAAISAFPAFHLLTEAANPALAQAQRSAPVVVYADPRACSLQFDLLGRNKFESTSCDIAKAYLTRAGVSYRTVALAAGAPTEIHAGATIVRAPDPHGLDAEARTQAVAAFGVEARQALTSVGYPASAAPAEVNTWLIVAVVAFLSILGAATYAPGAALLVELFPARIRYTSMSFPYHLAVGWIGGFLPATAFAIVAASGDIYSGLWYPVGFAVLTTIVGALFLPETRGRSID